MGPFLRRIEISSKRRRSSASAMATKRAALGQQRSAIHPSTVRGLVLAARAAFFAVLSGQTARSSALTEKPVFATNALMTQAP